MITITRRYLIDEADLDRAIEGTKKYFPTVPGFVVDPDFQKPLVEWSNEYRGSEPTSEMELDFEARLEALLSSLKVKFVYRSQDRDNIGPSFKVTHPSNLEGLTFYVADLEHLRQFFLPNLNPHFPGAKFEELTITRL